MDTRKGSITHVCHVRSERRPGRLILAGLAAVFAPVATVVLAATRGDVNLTSDVLTFLVGVILVALVGGFIPALLEAVAGSLLLNWFFTPPVHQFTIADANNAWAIGVFIIVAVLGIVGGAVLDIYSSGLALLSAGLKIPRYAAAGVDGVIMLLGTIYIVFAKQDFLAQFEGFLITVGVLIAAWCGVFLGDLVLRSKDYSDDDLFRNSGRYGDIRLIPVVTTVVASVIGWGLVTNSGASWLTWQGYLLGPFHLGGKTGNWEYANLGVFAALVLGFLVTIIFTSAQVRHQEEIDPAPATLSSP